VDEALCFGWIDSSMKPIDDEKYGPALHTSQEGSNWSESNKKRAARLIEQGRMNEAELATIEEAKRNGKWDTGPTTRPRAASRS
jgi:uncharacterized protein YdeI (YjbR/CyaY-like superfamily)